MMNFIFKNANICKVFYKIKISHWNAKQDKTTKKILVAEIGDFVGL